MMVTLTIWGLVWRSGKEDADTEGGGREDMRGRIGCGEVVEEYVIHTVEYETFVLDYQLRLPT